MDFFAWIPITKHHFNSFFVVVDKFEKMELLAPYCKIAFARQPIFYFLMSSKTPIFLHPIIQIGILDLSTPFGNDGGKC